MELYQKGEYCMMFSIEDIQTEYIEKLKQFVNGQIQVDYDGPDGTIDYVTFECGANTFAVRFYGFETALYINEEKLMLVDDWQRTRYTVDHLYGNVVYGGSLRTRTHKEILGLLLMLTRCFIGCSGFEVTEIPVRPTDCELYGGSAYRLVISNANVELEYMEFENIKVQFVR